MVEEDPGFASRDWYFGVLFATLGCLSGSLGDNLVRFRCAAALGI